MKTLKRVILPNDKKSAYLIQLEDGILSQPHRWLKHYQDIVIITDHTIKKHYGYTLEKQLKQLKKRVLLLSIKPGELSKTTATKSLLEEKMLKNHYGRDTLILALGGGVIGDLAGYIAATYMRGIDFIQLPTTLLAMIDSSIGGKTGINTPQGKNLIGAFYQPKAIIADTSCLKTLSKKQLMNGLFEAIKIFLTCDADSFYYVIDNIDKIRRLDSKILHTVIARAITLKVHIIQQDEKEHHLRMILNFGHTIGHALEHVSEFTLLHGYAVGYGILLEAHIAKILSHLSTEEYTIIAKCLSKLGIQATDFKKFPIDKIIQATKIDKKNSQHQTHYILLNKIGNIYTKNKRISQPVPDKIVKKAYLG